MKTENIDEEQVGGEKKEFLRYMKEKEEEIGIEKEGLEERIRQLKEVIQE